MKTSNFDRENFGKLFIRLVLGPVLTAKGIVFFAQGRVVPVVIGKIFATGGMAFWPLIFGWAVAVICVVCGVTFAIGAFFRTSSFLLGTLILLEAVFKHLIGVDLMDGVAYILMLSAVMYGFVFIGPGTCVVQNK